MVLQHFSLLEQHSLLNLNKNVENYLSKVRPIRKIDFKTGALIFKYSNSNHALKENNNSLRRTQEKSKDKVSFLSNNIYSDKKRQIQHKAKVHLFTYVSQNIISFGEIRVQINENIKNDKKIYKGVCPITKTTITGYLENIDTKLPYILIDTSNFTKKNIYEIHACIVINEYIKNIEYDIDSKTYKEIKKTKNQKEEKSSSSPLLPPPPKKIIVPSVDEIKKSHLKMADTKAEKNINEKAQKKSFVIDDEKFIVFENAKISKYYFDKSIVTNKLDTKTGIVMYSYPSLKETKLKNPKSKSISSRIIFVKNNNLSYEEKLKVFCKNLIYNNLSLYPSLQKELENFLSLKKEIIVYKIDGGSPNVDFLNELSKKVGIKEDVIKSFINQRQYCFHNNQQYFFTKLKTSDFSIDEYQEVMATIIIERYFLENFVFNKVKGNFVRHKEQQNIEKENKIKNEEVKLISYKVSLPEYERAEKNANLLGLSVNEYARFIFIKLTLSDKSEKTLKDKKQKKSIEKLVSKKIKLTHKEIIDEHKIDINQLPIKILSLIHRLDKDIDIHKKTKYSNLRYHIETQSVKIAHLILDWLEKTKTTEDNNENESLPYNPLSGEVKKYENRKKENEPEPEPEKEIIPEVDRVEEPTYETEDKTEKGKTFKEKVNSWVSKNFRKFFN